jgi:hypothetical protein
MNVHGVGDVGQTEIHTAQLLASDLCAFRVEMAIEKLKKNKSPGILQILADFIISGGRGGIRSEIHELITSVWNKEKLPEEWKESIIVPLYKRGDKADCSNMETYNLCQLCTKFYPKSCCEG